MGNRSCRGATKETEEKNVHFLPLWPLPSSRSVEPTEQDPIITRSPEDAHLQVGGWAQFTTAYEASNGPVQITVFMEATPNGEKTELYSVEEEERCGVFCMRISKLLEGNAGTYIVEVKDKTLSHRVGVQATWKVTVSRRAGFPGNNFC